MATFSISPLSSKVSDMLTFKEVPSTEKSLFSLYVCFSVKGQSSSFGSRDRVVVAWGSRL